MTESIAVAAGSAAIVVAAIVALVAALRHRDPVGRAIAGHATVVGALRDSASRATNAPSGSATSSRGTQARAGVTVISATSEKGQPEP